MSITTTTTVESKILSLTPRFSWERGPLPLIPTPAAESGYGNQYINGASEMALVHNCIIRAMNSIYIQAPHVPPSSHKSFVSYSLATYEGLMAHHDGEEDFLFPEMERLTGEKGLMDVNISQHEKFHTGLDAWGKYLRNLQSNPHSTTFSGIKCRALMDTFIEPLSTHLAEEIPTLMALSRFGDGFNLAALLKAEGEKVMGGLSKANQLPMFLINHDAEFEGGIHNFPPVPAPVKWVLFQVFGRWQYDWWKFGTVGYDGKGRELLFLGEEESEK